MMKQLIALLLLTIAVLSYEPFQVIFEWKQIDFQWPSDELRQLAVQEGDYIPSSSFISTVKFWKDKMYVTLPRWKDGAPVTLAVTTARPVNDATAPLLEPYPDLDMQKLGDCSAFQLVHSIEIDPRGRMWVLDTGRPKSLRESQANCPARLVILDLEDNGKILRTYEFPDDVARRDDTYLNDIVLDHEDGVMAYITDSGQRDPGIIVYSLKNNTSWKVRHDSMKAKSEAISFMVAKTHVIEPINVDGIALSPASCGKGKCNRQIYYTPLSSFHLYSVPVHALKNNATYIDRYVRELGRTTSQIDGMVMSSTGVLYFGLLADDAIAMWDTKTASFTTGQRIISRDHVLTQWPDSFSFDGEGNLWCVTNMLQNVLSNRVNTNEPNCRLIRTRVGFKSYLYYENGTAPEWPNVTAGAESVRLAFVALLVIVLTFGAK